MLTLVYEEKMRSISRTLVLFTLVSSLLLSVVALNKNNHRFLGKVVSRVEEAVHNFQSIIHKEKSDNGSGSQPKQWAVLVAGSNGYYNYRHQVNIAMSPQLFQFYNNFALITG